MSIFVFIFHWLFKTFIYSLFFHCPFKLLIYYFAFHWLFKMLTYSFHWLFKMLIDFRKFSLFFFLNCKFRGEFFSGNLCLVFFPAVGTIELKTTCFLLLGEEVDTPALGWLQRIQYDTHFIS